MQFLLDTGAFFLAGVLLDKQFLLRYALDQLFGHGIELLFQLPDFISLCSWYALRVVAAGELSCCFPPAVKATYYAPCCQYGEDWGYRRCNHEPEYGGQEPELHKREDIGIVVIECWQHLYIDGAYRFVFTIQNWLDD